MKTKYIMWFFYHFEFSLNFLYFNPWFGCSDASQTTPPCSCGWDIKTALSNRISSLRDLIGSVGGIEIIPIGLCTDRHFSFHLPPILLDVERCLNEQYLVLIFICHLISLVLFLRRTLWCSHLCFFLKLPSICYHLKLPFISCWNVDGGLPAFVLSGVRSAHCQDSVWIQWQWTWAPWGMRSGNTGHLLTCSIPSFHSLYFPSVFARLLIKVKL